MVRRITLKFVILNTDPSASYSARCVKWPARKAPIDRESSDRFPALFILAGVAASEFLAIVGARRQALRRSAVVLAGVGTVVWACASSYLWFSGLALAYGKPNETEVAEQTTSQLEPGTLVIADLWHPYGPGKLTYLLGAALRDGARQPVFWYVVDADRDLRAVMENPERSIEYARPNAFYYR